MRSASSRWQWLKCAYLVIVRGSHEYDGTLAGNVKRAPGSDLAEEYVGDDAPKDERGVIDEVRGLAAMYNLHADQTSSGDVGQGREREEGVVAAAEEDASALITGRLRSSSASRCRQSCVGHRVALPPHSPFPRAHAVQPGLASTVRRRTSRLHLDYLATVEKADAMLGIHMCRCSQNVNPMSQPRPLSSPGPP